MQKTIQNQFKNNQSIFKNKRIQKINGFLKFIWILFFA